MSYKSPEAGASGPAEPLHERLRRRRQACGVDLEALSRETRIQMRYLEAIELGQVHLLPQGVYMRNFIRVYLRAVGMENAAEIQNTIDQLTAGVLRLPITTPLPVPPPRQPQGPPAWTVAAVGGGAAVLLLLMGWVLWRLLAPQAPGFGSNRTAAAAEAAQPPPPTGLPEVLRLEAEGPAPAPPRAPASAASIPVMLRANRRVWLSVTPESGEPQAISLQKDEAVEVPVTQPTTLEFSGGGAVDVTIGGRSVPAARLRSRALRIDPESLEELFSEPAPAPRPTPKPASTPTMMSDPILYPEEPPP